MSSLEERVTILENTLTELKKRLDKIENKDVYQVFEFVDADTVDTVTKWLWEDPVFEKVNHRVAGGYSIGISVVSKVLFENLLKQRKVEYKVLPE